MEQWIKIPDSTFEVSSIGRVRNTLTGKMRALSVDGSGYHNIMLHNRKTHKIHRLVAEAFIPNPEEKRTVNHINGIKTDNRVENLEWATYQENSIHSIKTGLQVSLKGSQHGASKVSEDMVLKIRNDHKNDKVEYLALLFGLSIGSISMIRNRKTWRHI